MALSYIWTGIVLVSLLFGIWNSSGAQVSAAALEGAASAISIAITMAGPICLWSGVSELLDASGASERIAAVLSPLLKRLFPDTKSSSPALNKAAGCVTANLLGLGNAATPLGIEAVAHMKAMQKDKTRASDSMCRFIVVCTASIQLIPTTVAALRSAAGCASPFDILPAVWLTSVVSVCAGLGASLLLARFIK